MTPEELLNGARSKFLDRALADALASPDADRQARGQLAQLALSGASDGELESFLASRRASTAQAQGFTLETDVFAPLPRRNYLIPGLNIGPGAPNGFFAFSWSGKSIIVQDLVLSIASGSHVFGQFPCRQGRVVHVDYEQGSAETRDRYQRLARARGLTAENIGDRIAFASLPSIYLNSPAAEDAYKRAAEGAVALYVDSLSAGQPGVVENDTVFAEGLHMLNRVSAATGATVLVVGHTGKADLSPEKNPDGRVAPRGTSAIISACGSAFALSGASGDPKLVRMIKGRTLGGARAEDFYLRLESARIDGYVNPENPSDPGGFRVVYQTAEQVNPPRSPESELDDDVGRIVATVGRHAGATGVAGADAVVRLAGMKATRGRSALKVATARGVVRNIATRKDGGVDDQHPRFVVQTRSTDGTSSDL